MPDIADPLIQGMMAGLRFKEVFQRAKQQREELDMRKQALAEAKAQHERQAQLHELTMRRQNLQDRLAMATNPALEDVTGGGGTRTVTAAVPPEMQSPVGLGKTFSMEAPVENPIEYGGRQYAVRGPQERFNEKLQMETALAEAKRKAAEVGWVPFETPSGQRFNLPPQSVGGAQRAFYPPVRPTPPPRPFAPHVVTDAKGNVSLVQKTENGVEVSDLGPIGSPKQAAGGQGTLSGLRFEETKDKRRQDAIDKKAKEFRDLEIKESTEWAKAQELQDVIAAGGYMVGSSLINPTTDAAKQTILATMKATVKRHKDAAQTFMKQKKQAYDDLVKVGGATPMGGSPAAAQTKTLDQRLEGTPLAAPQKPAAKTFPRTRLGDYANANNMSVPQAEAALAKLGYTIN